MYKLEAIGVKYSQKFWETALCDSSINSSCWRGECLQCMDGLKITPTKSFNQSTTYKQWETLVSDDGNQKKTEAHYK